MDIALFSVVTAATLFLRIFPRVARIVSPTLVLIAASAKGNLVFALPAFVDRTRSHRGTVRAVVSGRVRHLCGLRFSRRRARGCDCHTGRPFFLRRAHPARSSLPSGRRRPVGRPASAQTAHRVGTSRCHGRNDCRLGPSPPGASRC